MSKITFQEYLARKLFGIKKKRVRKKITKRARDLFTDYCSKRWGVQGLLYSVYSEVDLQTLVYNENPFLRVLPKDDSFTGTYVRLPDGT